MESKVQADLDIQEKKLRAEESKLSRARELAEAEEKKLKAQTAALKAQKLLDVTAGTPTPHPNYAKPKLPPLTEFSQVRPRARSDRPMPFQPVTLVEIPFQRVIIDIVGPLPVSQNRYEYILTLVDLSTR
ncbi:integrase core domain [Plakobranchus ocellatus]|uniref:Integrase core domain n=1 Tax=Plakobranchus ocellatus TaxID=259542 RepID=A0AAV4CD31_9GAST|nr:integrase core domain [Plakobranchus ocellatus]